MKSYYFFIILFFFACGTSKNTINKSADVWSDLVFTDDDQDFELLEEQEPDEVGLYVQLEHYRPSFERKWDLIHTGLEVSFDWEKQRLHGKAILILCPLAYPDSVLVLDAKNFDIHDIRDIKSDRQLTYQYDSTLLHISLNRVFQRKDTLHLKIVYTAKPAERTRTISDGAISSDQGLFFINPLNDTKGKPMQIWTQGETSHNSCWFPTIDHPNERCTGEIRIEIEDRFVTLSNGILKSTQKKPNGKRVDHWQMNIPHAPYLFMMAIGEFAVVKDSWLGMDLAYYVEPKYSGHAKEIFNHTPEMLSFFSDLFGLKYPWQKYHQVIVRDYVSGAMENTTAVIFGDFIQKTKRQLLEENNDKIVAHELAHHWFGNYVTCESWANLTMNEGFANYAEYLWLEHKYGKEEADFHRAQELSGYLEDVQEKGARHLIRFYYEDEQEMFDPHSYNKGGLVLHHLRNILGDEVFFAGVKLFLAQNALKPVEAHHLRLAMEEVSGKDLNWFFNQWFFDKGHPEIEVKYEWDADNKRVSIALDQVQQAWNSRLQVFQIPTEIALFHADGSITRHPVTMNQRSQQIEINCSTQPLGILFDPYYHVPARIIHNFEINDDYLRVRFRSDISGFYKLEGLHYIEYLPQEDYAYFIGHPYHLYRSMALEKSGDWVSRDTLWKIALEDPSPIVRSQALELILSIDQSDESDTERAIQIINKGEQETGANAGLALSMIADLRPEWAAKYILDNFEKEEDPEFILSMIQTIYNNQIDLPFELISDKIEHFKDYNIFSYLSYIYTFSESIDAEKFKQNIQRMGDFIAFGDSRVIQRYAFITLLANLKGESENALKQGNLDQFSDNQEKLIWIIHLIETIKSRETNPQLREVYDYIR